MLAGAAASGGFASTQTNRGMPRFSHETTVDYFVRHFGLDAEIAADIKAKRDDDATLDASIAAGARHVNCNGAFSAHIVGSQMFPRIVPRWKACSLVQDCVCPRGSNLGNHRQDQAALTLLAVAANHSCKEDSPGGTLFGYAHGMSARGGSPTLEQIMHFHGLHAKDPFCLAGSHG